PISTWPLICSFTFPTTIERTIPVLAIVGNSATRITMSTTTPSRIFSQSLLRLRGAGSGEVDSDEVGVGSCDIAFPRCRLFGLCQRRDQIHPLPSEPPAFGGASEHVGRWIGDGFVVITASPTVSAARFWVGRCVQIHTAARRQIHPA